MSPITTDGLVIRCRLFRPWDTSKEFDDAAIWVKLESGGNVEFVKHGGFSGINGVTYYNYILFNTEEDLIFFKLKFTGLQVTDPEWVEYEHRNY